MDKAKNINIAKDLILDGKITEFVDVFNYIDRTFIHAKTGMNYYRLLRNVKNPKRFTMKDVYTIARVLKVPPEKIITLMMNQIEAAKRK